jgi:hypothetical protein
MSQVRRVCPRDLPAILTTARRRPGDCRGQAAASAEAEALLREMAFVYHLTRRVKREMRAGKEVPAEPPA